MDDRDPVRWARPDADVPDALREVLRSAAADDASAERLADFVGRVKSTLAAAPPPPAAGWGAAKTLAAVTVVAGGALVAWLAFGSHGAAPKHTPAATIASASPAPHASSASEHSSPQTASPASPLATGSAPSSASLASSSAPPSASPLAPSSAQSSALAPSSAQSSASPPATSSASSSLSTNAARSPSDVVPHARNTDPQAVRGPTDTLDQEVRLLQAARQVVDSDPARALRLAEQHRARFPRGALAQEREVLMIQALARQGRAAEAQDRANRFRQEYPGSAHLDQLPTEGSSSHN